MNQSVFKKTMKRCRLNPEFEARTASKRPLRGPQLEMIQKAEAHVKRHDGEIMTIKSSRQTGKNEVEAILERRHLLYRQFNHRYSCWIRTAPTHKPQLVNSKKRLREHLLLNANNIIRYPLFQRSKLAKEEGYIWRVGNAAVEFLSSGPQANVVGATASTCLSMDEAHKVDKAKFDEDFAPFTADTSAGTILWGVGGNGLDTLQYYIDANNANGKKHLNLSFPCDYWIDVHPPYRKHVESRVNILGWDHPIIMTQYRLMSIAARARYLNDKQVRSILSGEHERQLKPRPGRRYEVLVDLAGGNEEFNPDDALQGMEDVPTDSTAIIVYEVTDEIAYNNVFPIIHIVNIIWLTGTDLGVDEEMIEETIKYWNAGKVTIDSIGVGRQIGENMEKKFGPNMVNKYIASDTDVSEDCYDLQARVNFDSIKMFINDDSPEWKEFERQLGHTHYQAAKGKMKLIKPKPTLHIDIIKALTYINRNKPEPGLVEIFANEGDYAV